MRTPWTEADLLLLRAKYPWTPTWELAIRMNRTQRAIYDQANSMGLRKTEEYMQSPEANRLRPGHKKGKATQFKPGHRPHNHGKKGWDAGGNSAKTRFRHGHQPHNTAKIGAERVSKEGILQRKVSDTGYPPRDWKSVHSLVWESANGPVPAGHIVVFRNGNLRDIRIENLELITRAENMRRNSVHNLPDELADVCRIKGVLNRHIHRIEKRLEERDEK